ncbi:membrane dipeptidase [Pseudomonas sp. ABC1]|uniref:dipeptidase n=1 Tax=Pseudomonas sp. ABC1 TaxID=2748080 RepID=UPI0015C3D926|nr:dipeptidase [Pseudomonas sp. ABC1]QLF91742.1 membrane dipeptidase [Pseudomonas sp. ABC1]
MNTRHRSWKWLIPVLILTLAVAAALIWWFVLRQSQPYPQEVIRRANALHEQMLSFDAHLDIPLDYGSPGIEANHDGHSQFDLVKAGKGRLSGGALTIWSWPEFWTGPNSPHRPTPGFLEAMQSELEVRYRIITGIAKDYPNQAAIAYSPADFRRLAHEGKFAIVISMLNAAPLGDDIDKLDTWAARGVRIFGPGYVGNNSWTDSARPLPFLGDTEDELGGLSEIGRTAIERLNDLGVIIDVSQMSSNALRQTAELTRAPIIASHSGVRGTMDIRRNLSDEDLRYIRNTGGVAHIIGYSGFLKPFSRETIARMNELRAQYGLPDIQNMTQVSTTTDPIFSIWSEEKFGEYLNPFYGILGQEPSATLEQFVDAIDYAVKKIGIDHVGIGSDFNDGGGLIGWESVADNRNITVELIQRGYSDEDIAKLWGGNFLRVWEQVQQSANSTTKEK